MNPDAFVDAHPISDQVVIGPEMIYPADNEELSGRCLQGGSILCGKTGGDRKGREELSFPEYIHFLQELVDHQTIGPVDFFLF